MWSDWKLWAALLAVFVAGVAVSRNFIDETNSGLPNEADLVQMVLICRESGELFVGSARPTPAAHPKTGALTLLPAMYCPKDQHWHAAPAPELVQGRHQPIYCPGSKTPMTLTGPIPASASPL